MTRDAPVVVTPAVLRGRPLPEHGETTSKQDRGQVLVVGGTAETPGAVYLAGMAALRAGAGKLQLATPSSSAGPMAVAVPEARVIGVEGDAEAFDRNAVDAVEPLLEGAAAVLVGPGTFAPDASRAVLHRAVEVLADTDGRLIVDAGALPLIAEEPDLLRPLGDRAVVMPNPGEMALLLDIEGDAVDDDPEGIVRRAVDRLACVVTLRGGVTWTAGPASAVYVDESGGSGLATSGSGDVLGGLIAGYAARGAPALDAVLWGTHVHRMAAMRCVERLGEIGFLARDLLDEIGPSRRMLGA